MKLLRAQVNPLYAAISTDIAATIRVSLTSMNEISVRSPFMNGGIAKTFIEHAVSGATYLPELTALENVQLKNRLTNYKKKKEILALFETLVSLTK